MAMCMSDFLFFNHISQMNFISFLVQNTLTFKNKQEKKKIKHIKITLKLIDSIE